MKIKEMNIVRSTNDYDFLRALKKEVSTMESDGLIVEVQYSATKGNYDGQTRYTALVIGKGE